MTDYIRNSIDQNFPPEPPDDPRPEPPACPVCELARRLGEEGGDATK